VSGRCAAQTDPGSLSAQPAGRRTHPGPALTC